jgi:hypothetical protein
MLLSYDHGRLACDETPYSLWEKKEILLIFFFLSFQVFKFFPKKTIILVWYPDDDNATH